MNLRYTLLIVLFSTTISFAQSEFITVWETTTTGESITIPTATDATYDYTVNWGDGSAVESGLTGDATHTYATAGNHTVTITGTFPRIYFNNAGDKAKILEVKQWGNQAWTSMEKAFYGCSKLNITATDVPDLSNVTSFNQMFRSTLLETANRIGDWNTGTVTNMEWMFAYVAGFNQNISSWDTSAVTEMTGIFAGASTFNQDISGWETGAVTEMNFMFYGATAFDQDLSNWNISAVTNMTSMFLNCSLSTTNYDSMLDSWSNKTVQTGIVFDGGNSKHCLRGEIGKEKLKVKNWEFSDDGRDTAAACGTIDTSFVTLWRTTAENESITIPIATGETYNYTVDWGDGSTTDSEQTGAATHSYATPGDYYVSISGTFPRIYFNYAGDKTKILEVKQWGNQTWTSMEKAFYGCSNLNITATDVPDLSNVTSLSYMFRNASLETANTVSDWDVSTIEDMGGMFQSASINADLSDWDTSSVTNMSYMFTNAIAFNQDISRWKTGSVTNMTSMFTGARVFNQNIGSWDTSKVTDMSYMFSGATAFNQDISEWVTSNVTTMRSMFYGATAFNQNIGSWVTSKVTNMSYMFYEVRAFNQDISNWDTSAVTKMVAVFFGAQAFNQDIGRWVTGSVTDMSYMFYNATAFNQDISDWVTSSVTRMSYMFYDAAAFNQNIGSWVTSKVTNMSHMFRRATAFNQDISEWNTSAVTNMYYMFSRATAFNQDLSDWVTSNVTTMRSMFYGATAFNQDLSNWDIGAVTDMAEMFTSVTLSTANYDSMLDSWSEQAVQSNVILDGGNSKYCDLGEAGKAVLAEKGWSITDGSKDTSGSCDAFIMAWETTTAGESITIPTAPDETYDYTVDWGDGTVESGQTGNAMHTYATAGNYDVTITGTFPRIYFNNTGDKAKILEVKKWGNQVWTSMEKAFDGCSKLNITATDTPDLSNVTSLSYMFRNASLQTANAINEWVTSTITNMSFVFFSSNFNQDISNWETSAVTDMSWMFGNSPFNQDISRWNTSAVTNMDKVFTYASTFDQDLSNWDVSKVTSMFEIFFNATLSTANYDSILDSWSKQTVQSNVSFHGGNSKYCDLGEAGKAVLEEKGWYFHGDGGKDSETICGTLGTSVSAYSPWAIYPNPVKNRVYVSGSTVPKRIEVFGIDGRKFLDESGVDNVGVDQLNNGMYLVKLSASNGSSQVFKLIKE
ncbi:MAG: Uncharacterised protein [Bacteroidota bacterium]|nr:MAG: Uncharacterised protein [Bacteroidota bacterium]